MPNPHEFFNVMWDWYVNAFALILIIGTLASTIKWVYKKVKGNGI